MTVNRSRMLNKFASSVLASFRPSTLTRSLPEFGSTGGAFPFAKIHFRGTRPIRNAVCPSSVLHSLRPCRTKFLSILPGIPPLPKMREPVHSHPAAIRFPQPANPGRWILVAVAVLSLVSGTTGQATTSIPQGAVVEVDQATVNQILDVFHKAEAAIAAENLDGVMALYATQYNYHGLKQADVRKIWHDLFEEYRDLSEVHFFSKIVKVGSGSNAIIEVTCTGSLSGLSKTSGLRVPIDSWYEEVHYLTLEGGAWRIRGNAGERPRVLPFGTAPHPLF